MSVLFLMFVLPVLMAGGVFALAGGPGFNWWMADRSSAGLLPPAQDHPDALVRIFAAPTVGWRGVVASHCWIVIKRAGETRYRRFDYTAWGEPVSRDRFAADARWFGRDPELVFAADGADADAMAERIEAAVASYPLQQRGDYRAWPGPNSNTFVAAIAQHADVPAILPPTAIGKDFPANGRWFGPTLTGTGYRLTLGGYAAVTLGLREGLEISLGGLVIGVDLLRPALKLPAFGRLGL